MIIDIIKKETVKKKILFFVFMTLTVLWMMVIFGFSSSDAAESTIQSNTVTEVILRIFNGGFDDLSPDEQQALIDSCDRVVRKLAHFTAYACLGFLGCFTMYFAPFWTDKKKSLRYLPVFMLCALFAATDEYHQTLVDGRAGRFTDVLIDSSGALFGMAIVAGVGYFFFAEKKK